MKKLLKGIMTISTAATPVISVVSCVSSNTIKYDLREIKEAKDMAATNPTGALTKITTWMNKIMDQAKDIVDKKSTDVKIELIDLNGKTTDFKPSEVGKLTAKIYEVLGIPLSALGQ